MRFWGVIGVGGGPLLYIHFRGGRGRSQPPEQAPSGPQYVGHNMAASTLALLLSASLVLCFY